ncbi:MAG: hypothetical protein GY816_14195, partial [Cytophagales bacterium]|nr:hypothetical protein [Cytophagales bacterium]
MARKYRTNAEVDQAIKTTDTSTSISDCQGKEVKIIGQAIVRLKQGSVSCNTPMLLLQGDQTNMEPLIGMYGLKQLGLQLTTIDREELIGQRLTAAQKEGIPIIDAPVELPKTRHTQINLLKPCFSTKPLQLGPLRRGKIQMQTHESTEKGSYLFVPSHIGEEAGLKVAAISVNKHGKFKLPVQNPSPQKPVRIDIGSTIGTVGQATIISMDQLQTKMFEKEEGYQSKLEESYRVQREGLTNGRVDKLLEVLPFGQSATIPEIELVQDVVKNFNDVFA